jgi:hypothetical protein
MMKVEASGRQLEGVFVSLMKGDRVGVELDDWIHTPMSGEFL